MIEDEKTFVNLTQVINLRTDRVQELNVILPVPQASAYQSEAEILDMKPAPDGILFDNTEGNRFVYWKVNNLRSGSFTNVSLYYSLIRKNPDIDLAEVSLENISPHALPIRYTQVNDPEWTETANSVVSKGLSIKDIISKIWSYTVENIQSDNCSDYSLRSLQLLRGLGIPSRIGYGTAGISIIGNSIRIFRSDDDQKYVTVGVEGSQGCPHTWTEFYIPKYGWLGLPGSYRIYSIADTHADPYNPYELKLLPGWKIGPVYDSGRIWKSDNPEEWLHFYSTEMQTEFTGLYSTSELNLQKDNCIYPERCPFSKGRSLNCLGFQNNIICCLYCPYRSSHCEYTTNYYFWRKDCLSCTRIWSANSQRENYEKIDNLINKLSDKNEQKKASEELLHYGENCVHQVITATANSDSNIKLWAGYVLSRMSAKTIINSLKMASHQSSPDERDRMLKYLRDAMANLTSLANYALLEKVCKHVLEHFKDFGWNIFPEKIEQKISGMKSKDKGKRWKLTLELRYESLKYIPYVIPSTASENDLIRFWTGLALSGMSAETLIVGILNCDKPGVPWEKDNLLEMLKTSPQRLRQLSTFDRLKQVCDKTVDAFHQNSLLTINSMSFQDNRSGNHDPDSENLQLVGCSFSQEKYIRIIKEAGFNAVEYCLGGTYNEHQCCNKKLIMRNLNLYPWSLHSWWDQKENIFEKEPAAKYIEVLRKSVYNARILEVKYIVTHPSKWSTKQPLNKLKDVLNAEVELLDRVWKPGVKYAFENGSTIEGLEYGLELANLLGREKAGICVDTGHASLGTLGPARAIKMADDWLLTTHLQDNHGNTDEHLPPGEGNIDWETVVEALIDIKYKGCLMVELGPSQKSRINEAINSAAKAVGEFSRKINGIN